MNAETSSYETYIQSTGVFLARQRRSAALTFLENSISHQVTQNICLETRLTV
jgi:hypothetical protein